jgi:endonuclease YncB( thermonuclease family)
MPLMRRFALSLSLILATLAAWGAEYAARVVRIADGDTITILKADNTQETLSLAAIDAPEPDQPYGARSKDALALLIAGRPVKIEEVGLGRDGRAAGTVWLVDVNINAEMVRQGYAWVDRNYSKDHALLALEAEARTAGRGLWADSDPVPPWEWPKR